MGPSETEKLGQADSLEDLLKWASLKAHPEEMDALEWALRPAAVEDLLGKSVLEVAALSGVALSKGFARKFVQQGALFMNFRKVLAINQIITEKDIIHGRILFRVGRECGMVKSAS